MNYLLGKLEYNMDETEHLNRIWDKWLFDRQIMKYVIKNYHYILPFPYHKFSHPNYRTIIKYNEDKK